MNAADSQPRRHRAKPGRHRQPVAQWRLQRLAGLLRPRLEASQGLVRPPSPDGPPHGKSRVPVNCDAQRGHRHRNAHDLNQRGAPARPCEAGQTDWPARRHGPNERQDGHHWLPNGNPERPVGPRSDWRPLWNQVGHLGRMADHLTTGRLESPVERLARMTCPPHRCAVRERDVRRD